MCQDLFRRFALLGRAADDDELRPGVLRCPIAIQVNISIMRAFVALRQMITGYQELLKRIEELEESTDAQFSEIYQALTQLLSKPEPKPRKPIGYRTYDE